MVNNIESKNPYGKIDMEVLNDFEKELNVSIPEEYRNYLIKFNGSDFEKCIVQLPGDIGDTTVHHMFGIHAGPEYRQLIENYNDSFNLTSGNYIPICDDSFGNIFYLKIKGENLGAIYFCDHKETYFSFENLIFVSAGFNDFIASMKSDEEMMIDFKNTDPVGYDEFQKRLDEMDRLRREELDSEK